MFFIIFLTIFLMMAIIFHLDKYAIPLFLLGATLILTLYF